MCFSMHDSRDNDGLLSMWRGYGGSGRGAAVVLDTSKIEPRSDSPIIISNVTYGSTEDRLAWIDKKISEVAAILRAEPLARKNLRATAWALWQRLILFAPFSKHKGFEEEREWRVVYIRNRDYKKEFDPLFGYFIGAHGVEPKLKLKLKDVPGATGLSAETLIDRIILGPSIAAVEERFAILRMLDVIGRSSLKERVRASSIPFRNTS